MEGCHALPQIEGMSHRVQPGDRIPPRRLVAVDSSTVTLPDPGGAFTHLLFRRYAGCPICNLHLRTFARRHAELLAANARVVAIFHSSAEELGAAQSVLPFPLLPDPERKLYAEFGVGTSLRSVLDPRAWSAAFRAVASRASPDPSAGRAGGAFGLPADLLISPRGRVVAAKYGVHADDNWSVDAALALLASARERDGASLEVA